MRSFFALALFCATSAFAQPYLVKDLNTTGPVDGSSNPGTFVSLGSSLYFTTSGRDTAGVWRLDGPASAPVQVLASRGITAMTPFHGQLVVAGYGGLTITDGTPQSVTHFSDAPVYRGPLIEASGHLVFVRNSNELWSTDGTAEGTATIDFHPQGSPNATLLGAFGGRVVFVSTYGVGITDGTAAGTTILAPSITYAGNIVVSGDRFFFAGFRYRDAYGGGLWVSDGTPAGTHITKDVSNGYNGSLLDTSGAIAAIGGNRVVYWPNSTTAMWVTDGTDAGTIPIANIQNVNAKCAVLNGVVYFPGSELPSNPTGTLWRTDGTAAGTRAVATLPDRFTRGISSALGRIWVTSFDSANGVISAHLSLSDGTSIRVLTSNDATHPVAEWSGRAYFAGFDAAHGYELWSSDGTPDGTARVADLEPNIGPSSYATPVATTATRVLFTATGDVDGYQTWSSDGTAEGTEIFPFKISGSIRFGDIAYFTNDKHTELYRTDGTPEGTKLVYTFPDYDMRPIAATKNLLYIHSGTSLWATDGTTEGTSLVVHSSINPSTTINLGGRIVYQDGSGLYAIDGRNAPRLIMTGVSGPTIAAGGRIFFTAPGTNGTALLVTDGTADGIRLLATFSRGGFSPLGAVGNRILFATNDGVHDLAVWSSDGTPEGTMLVRAIRPSGQASIDPVGAANDRVLFLADDGTFGPHLWSSDGTAAGTVMLPATKYDNAIVAKGLSFFTAPDPLHGTELWQSDGTVDGTRLVGDIDAGPRSSNPGYLMTTRDTLFFQATALETGRELWALPLPGRTIAIDDTRAPNGATTAAMTISLDAASTQPVSATWSSTTGASGTIAFAPGETTKTITFAIAPDPVTHRNRFDYVRLTEIRGATPTKNFATVIEEGAAPSGDLSLSIGPGTADNRQRSIIVTNHGPDTVPTAIITYRSSVYAPSTYTTPVPSVAPGASASLPFTIDGYLAATVSSPTPDPDPTNNTLVIVGAVATNEGLSISLAPAVLYAGNHATLTIGTTSGSVSLTSSDPTVMAVPASASSGNIDVVALAPGLTTLTASIGSVQRSIDITVAAAGTTYRWPSQITLAIEGDRAFGSPLHLTAKIPSRAWDVNLGPTGRVTFYDGDTVVAIAYVNRNSSADTVVDSLLPGPHAIKAVYAGDEHFFGSATPPQTITILKPPPVTFFGTYAPRKGGTTADVTIVAVAPHARPATGNLTLKSFNEVLAAHLTFVESITVTTKLVNFVTIEYSGDDFYEPAVVSVTLSPVRHRAAP